MLEMTVTFLKAMQRKYNRIEGKVFKYFSGFLFTLSFQLISVNQYECKLHYGSDNATDRS